MKPPLATGYSLVELLLVMAIISILIVLSSIGIGDSQAKSRDTERTSDINILHSRLEEYYTDKGAYPPTLSDALLPGLDPEALIDPNGNSIDQRTPVTSQVTARNSADPDGSGADYAYIPYPTGCGPTTCRGYFLKSYIEKPSDPITNPYLRSGLHNN